MRLKPLINLAVLTFAAANPAKAQQVSVAGGDWRDIPLVKPAGKRLMSESVIDGIAAQKQSCPAIKGSARRIELSVPFLVHFNPAGAVEQVVIQRIGCPQVESLIGGSVAQMAKDGEYLPTLENRAGWYRGSFDIVTGETATLKSDQAVICKLVTPSGTLFPRRLCGTLRQWEDMRLRHQSAGRMIIDSGGDKVD